MCIKRSVFSFVVFLFLFSVALFVQAQPNAIGLRPVISGLGVPVYATHAGDGTNRMFIVEQGGKIKVLQPGATAPTEFLNVSSIVSTSGGERGLLGLAFHPQYSSNRRFFIFYTRQTDGAVQIAEYETSVGNPNLANPTAVRVIISIPHPVANHNGGTIQFGPDGYLYAAIGDGTGGNDDQNNAQNINVLLGKFLRIDVNTPVGQDPAYNIPPTNPYAGFIRGRDEIYAIGFRNPYRFSFDRGGTHQLWAGDVGQEAFEEVDIVNVGQNYGWRVFEGFECTGLDPSLCNPANYTPPVLQYRHNGGRCSVTGGRVYRGTLGTFPQGAYIFADFCTGEIFEWFADKHSVRLDTIGLPTAITEDEAGELYIVNLVGTLDKLVRRRTSADFDGDLRTDVSVFRPTTGVWYVLNSSNSNPRIQNFGLNGDIPASADFDGDLVSDVAVYRPSSGTWYYYRSSDATVGIVNFGTNGDIPAAADYDGDQKADLAVFRPSSATWYIFPSRTSLPYQRTFGTNGDIPVVGDYDRDGRTDIAVWRPSSGVWYWANAFNESVQQRHFGLSTDIPTQGDFDGDGRTDVAVFRPSEGAWYTTRSVAGDVIRTEWGISGDIPVVGDYDGDGRDDIAVFRPSTGFWHTITSSNQGTVHTQFGTESDIPVPKYSQ